MKEKMTLEENTVFADLVLKPIMTHVDMAVQHGKFDPERLRLTLDAMEDQTGTLAAFPFPETMNKAESSKIMTDIYEKIIELIELRIKQKDVVLSQGTGTPGTDILKQMGLTC